MNANTVARLASLTLLLAFGAVCADVATSTLGRLVGGHVTQIDRAVSAR